MTEEFSEMLWFEYRDQKVPMLSALVLAVDPIQVYCRCPFCDEIHMHGSNGMIHDKSYGDRIPHCHRDNGRFHSYLLITCDQTARSEKVITDKKAAKRLFDHNQVVK
jgi:hypothetical protein